MKKYKVFFLLLLLVSILTISACKKTPRQTAAQKPPITLNYYRVFEPEDNLKAVFNKYQQANPHVKINYRNFTDLERYLETILSELAEGTGPDIISVPNTWIAQHYKKLSAAPNNLASPIAVQEAFVNVVDKDNIFIDTDGIQKVFGIPLSVDTLALYYNTQLLNQYVPEIGKPGNTWDSLKAISERISMADTNNNLIRSGIAIGTGTGISRSSDIFQLLLLQSETNLTDNNFSRFTYAANTKTLNAAKTYNSFNQLSSNIPSWQDDLGSETENEIYAFATGKTAMIFGYSYLYNDIARTIEIAKRNNQPVINLNNVRITEAPQLNPNTPPIYLANYYSETVTRNSNHKEEAWKLITYLADPSSLETYYKNNFKPTSRRELIVKQRNNPVYSAFVNQLGTATSLPLPDSIKANQIFKQLLNQIALANDQTIRTSLINSQNELNKEVSADGVLPPSRNKLAN